MEFWRGEKKKYPSHFHRLRQTITLFLNRQSIRRPFIFFVFFFKNGRKEKMRKLIYLNAAVSALATVAGKLSYTIR